MMAASVHQEHLTLHQFSLADLLPFAPTQITSVAVNLVCEPVPVDFYTASRAAAGCQPACVKVD